MCVCVCMLSRKNHSDEIWDCFLPTVLLEIKSAKSEIYPQEVPVHLASTDPGINWYNDTQQNDISAYWLTELITQRWAYKGRTRSRWQAGHRMCLPGHRHTWVISVLWCCWLGGKKGIQSVKKTEWWGAGVVICLERGADLHMAQLTPLLLTVSCFTNFEIGFTFLLTAHPDSPGQRAVKRVCVCVIVFLH